MHMFTVSAPFVGPDANASRQRHAPLYGRLVAEEHLPAAHRDAVHQVSFAKTFILYVLVIASCFFFLRDFFSLFSPPVLCLLFSFARRSLERGILANDDDDDERKSRRRREMKEEEKKSIRRKKKK